MRTTLNIPDDLVETISHLTGIDSKTEIIKRALSEFLNKIRRENIKGAWGKIPITLDTRKLRNIELNE